VYSRAWIRRNVRPSRNVKRRPATSPERFARFTDVNAQCIVKLELTRMIVLRSAK
jgi:hypothetical protein